MGVCERVPPAGRGAGPEDPPLVAQGGAEARVSTGFAIRLAGLGESLVSVGGEIVRSGVQLNHPVG